jgi:hypothetical protein
MKKSISGENLPGPQHCQRPHRVSIYVVQYGILTLKNVGCKGCKIADADRIVASTLPQLLSLFVHNKEDMCPTT